MFSALFAVPYSGCVLSQVAIAGRTGGVISAASSVRRHPEDNSTADATSNIKSLVVDLTTCAMHRSLEPVGGLTAPPSHFQFCYCRHYPALRPGASRAVTDGSQGDWEVGCVCCGWLGYNPLLEFSHSSGFQITGFPPTGSNDASAQSVWMREMRACQTSGESRSCVRENREWPVLYAEMHAGMRGSYGFSRTSPVAPRPRRSPNRPCQRLLRKLDGATRGEFSKISEGATRWQGLLSSPLPAVPQYGDFLVH